MLHLARFWHFFRVNWWTRSWALLLALSLPSVNVCLISAIFIGLGNWINGFSNFAAEPKMPLFRTMLLYVGHFILWQFRERWWERSPTWESAPGSCSFCPGTQQAHEPWAVCAWGDQRAGLPGDVRQAEGLRGVMRAPRRANPKWQCLYCTLRSCLRI